MSKDHDFDKLIIDNLQNLKIDDKVNKKINPWNKPFNFIIAGLILTTIVINSIWLEYILPTVGVILLYLGFRILRKGNRWFEYAYFLSILNLLLHSFFLIYVSTPLNTDKLGFIILYFTITSLRILILIMFRLAILKVNENTKFKYINDPLIWVLGCSILSSIISFLNIQLGYTFWLLLFVIYVLSLKSIYDIGDMLDDTGYSINSTNVRYSNKTILVSMFLVFTIIISISCVYSNHLKLTPNEFTKSDLNDSHTNLIEMWFPEDVLKDLPNDKVELFTAAINVHESTKLLKFFNTTYDPSRLNLEVTSIYVEMPNNILYGIVYFKWEDTKAYWRDGFLLTCGSDIEIIDGKLLYEKDYKEYYSSIPRLHMLEKAKTSNMHYLTGDVSYPFNTKNQRGYIIFRINNPELHHILFNYSHSFTPFEIPYVNTEQGILNGTKNFKQHMASYYNKGA